MTVKIQLLSDLHLEVHPHFVPMPAPGADLLVLAGDVGSYQGGSLLKDDDFGLGRFSPRYGWPTPVLYVPGNHEYDGLDFDATHARLRQTCERLGITWLERETVTLAQLTGIATRPVRFVGTTLWTDFMRASGNFFRNSTVRFSSTSQPATICTAACFEIAPTSDMAMPAQPKLA